MKPTMRSLLFFVVFLVVVGGTTDDYNFKKNHFEIECVRRALILVFQVVYSVDLKACLSMRL